MKRMAGAGADRLPEVLHGVEPDFKHGVCHALGAVSKCKHGATVQVHDNRTVCMPQHNMLSVNIRFIM